MQISSTFTLITLLAFFPFAIHAESDAEKPNPYPNDYIIIKPLKWVSDYLPIYEAEGKEAFRFSKYRLDPFNGMTFVALMDPSSKASFKLSSNNDNHCNDESKHEEDVKQKDNLPKRKFEKERRKRKGDVWRFNVLPDGQDVRQYYKYYYNNKNIGGSIYKEGNGQKDELVGLIRTQKRNLVWVDPNQNTETFTLSCANNSPVPEFATLLALVFAKASDC
ncbi:hypothetical protein PTTG_28742 [Puccinia triticina 1-1 BBBD Race 1]|uniref:Tubby C-terminal domain-containing protein n=2 Tax=Puccinia triticina TaxID=208348 RepID=A0A180G9X8_PUCT1|nr:uncharacterized protein PtA15_13A100 [Puccinia triticina]OAV89298.1 hypothetical protein PTTG_28742 [Puccinia triticina 1-1 BBBD Race 1]WAQ90701.1 hypothetical protein PtA15_13A100 [Puccinia triticina]WAR60889.1 hypothetical protein PtB15_13B138 [Puccinia triticina]